MKKSHSKKVLVIYDTKGFEKKSRYSLVETLNQLISPHIYQTFFTAYNRLEFFISDKNTYIYDHKNSSDIKEYDLVIFRKWQQLSEQALTCALYLDKHKIPYFDSEVGNVRSFSKLSAYMLLAHMNIPIPKTLFANHTILNQYMNSSTTFSFPIILKDAFSDKGTNNFLVHTMEELNQILKKNRRLHFVIQEFIPNTFDYRLLVFKYRVSFAFKRSRTDQSTHLNNTSQGATATQIDITDLDAQIIKIAENAAKAHSREIAGVDIVVDARTNNYYVLEVNNSPQIPSGVFRDEKVKAFADFIEKEFKEI